MDDKPGSKKIHHTKKVYVKPELKQIPLDDEEGLLEFCRGKPYDAQELKELIKRMLRPKERRKIPSINPRRVERKEDIQEL